MQLTDAVIDIYHGDELTDSGFHDMAKAGILAVILKATQGLKKTDPKFADRFKRLKSIKDLMDGAYHFGEDSDGAKQADHFLGVVGRDPGAYLMLDWESNPPDEGGTMTLDQAEAFVWRIRHETGKWPLLYSGESFLADQARRMKPSSPLLNCQVMLAKYGTRQPTLPAIWKRSWSLWQYSSTGSVPGVSGAVDRSRFAGSPDALQEWWKSHQV